MSASTSRDVLMLAGLKAPDAGAAGRKATTLAVLRRAGFDVPDGFVVTTDALDRVVRAAGPDTGLTAAGAAELDLDEELAARILAAAERLDGGPYAVRSSGVDEDGTQASHAGQYRTLLGVPGGAALLRAIRHCWASGYTEHVAAYRTSRGLPAAGRVAVLVQPMVPADAAGVAFTKNPVSGDERETIVNAVEGLGDRLVDGAVAADEWVVRDAAAQRLTSDGSAIDRYSALRVAALARRVAEHQGSPQDIEWALAGDRLVLLQARPIVTAAMDVPVPVPVPAEPPPGYWTREASHAPLPWTPFTRELLTARAPAIAAMCADFGFLLERVDLRDIGGWEYVRLVPLGGRDRRPPPDLLVGLLARLVPAVRRRVRACVDAYRTDLPARHITAWYDQWQPALKNRTSLLLAAEPSTDDPDQLAQHLDDAVALFAAGIMAHFRVHGAIALMLSELAEACRDLLGWDDGQTLRLLSGLSARSTEPAHRLAVLAALARERPAVRAFVAGAGPGGPAPTAAVDEEFAAGFADYQRTFGRRALRYEAADPNLDELPWLTLKLIRDQLTQGYDPQAEAADLDAVRTSAEQAARDLLATRSTDDRERFDRALSRARRAYPAREDKEFFTYSGPLAVVRRAALAVGRRLAAAGQIAAPGDVFFLEPPEAGDAVRAGTDQHQRVARRKAERAWVLAHPGPPSYGPDPGPPPSMDRWPREVAAANTALLWYLDRILGAAPVPGRPGLVCGLAAGPGRYTGPARVIAGEDDFHLIRPGDVLVCPTTAPVWSVLFPSIGALVTDTGGTLSHPAIIAREYRIPAVVGTGCATRTLRDGQLITVDGDAGTVAVVAS
ncbi:PEP/pyruvate-binding domain-containing protein [Actinoplanes sp. NPDC051470]|uniref:PEP/pyruvate-binding domain-containing protein n=1 Tax=unclassified Actinoplanes TaxID=2626549 RepID=UPI00341DBFFD